ncbi:MAG: SGNH/GDSL hydrolase family protein [Crocinitomicaceae bacterium]
MKITLKPYLTCLALSLVINLFAQTKTQQTYLALGDSYTVCESVNAAKQWPKQLVNKLNTNGKNISAPTIIAKTGWRTDNLLNAAKSEVGKKQFDVVSLLIGVNNEFQGFTPEDFVIKFRECLDFAIKCCKQGADGVFVVSIPDYGYTPFGARTKASISPRIDAYNKVCQTEAKEKKVKFFDITTISRQKDKKGELVAKDGLHPSARQYELWVESFHSEVFKLFK